MSAPAKLAFCSILWYHQLKAGDRAKQWSAAAVMCGVRAMSWAVALALVGYGSALAAPRSNVARHAAALLSEQTAPVLVADSHELDAAEMDIDPEAIENSPTLRRWLQSPPNVLDTIRNTPTVPTRVQIGLVDDRTWTVGIEDINLGDRVTLSGTYRRAWDGSDAVEYGAALRYYVAARGAYVNFGPQLGYRYLDRGRRSFDGVTYGLFGTVSLAPGAADLTWSYRLLEPQSASETTLVTVTTAYALSRSLRIAAQYNWWKSPAEKESSLGVLLEWVP
ncbi:MAG: hypothetical protein AAF704_15375 [Cyanobacteria bacterium P01_D01_bin.123]